MFKMMRMDRPDPTCEYYVFIAEDKNTDLLITHYIKEY